MVRRYGGGNWRRWFVVIQALALAAACPGGALWIAWHAADSANAAISMPAMVAELPPVGVVVARDGDGLITRVRCVAASVNVLVAVQWRGPGGSVEKRWSGKSCVAGRELGTSTAGPLGALAGRDRADVLLTVALEEEGRRRHSSVQRAFALGDDGLLREVAQGGISPARDQHGNRWWAVP